MKTGGVFSHTMQIIFKYNKRMVGDNTDQRQFAKTVFWENTDGALPERKV
jgi:hypothetical protein